jgi:hypothetical protein
MVDPLHGITEDSKRGATAAKGHHKRVLGSVRVLMLIADDDREASRQHALNNWSLVEKCNDLSGELRIALGCLPRPASSILRQAEGLVVRGRNLDGDAVDRPDLYPRAQMRRALRKDVTGSMRVRED